MNDEKSPFQALEKLFHEPNRLAIMSSLCAADHGLTFSQLKDECALTDGNLNRHLKVLRESRAIRIEKKFVDDKPRTTIFITDAGLDRFSDYLEALADIMKQTRATLPARSKTAAKPLLAKRLAT